MKESKIECTVNGELRTYSGAPGKRLLDVLREDWALTGAKEGCAEGECGACTIRVDGDPVCSCLVPIFQAHGKTLTTIEGLETDSVLDAIQSAFVVEGGVQCGACTPGMILTARALLDKTPNPSREDMREALAGNLCRCTGYEAIFRSLFTAMAKENAASQALKETP